MKRKLAVLLLSVFLLAFVTGCWSRSELNEFSIAAGMSVDKPGDMYEVAVQVLEPKQYASNKKGGGGQSPVILFKAKGYSISEALRKMTKTSPRRIHLGHLRILAIGEKTAREGLNEIIDFFRRNRYSRADFDIVIAKGSAAENILTVMSPIDNVPAAKVYQSIEASEDYLSSAGGVKLDALITTLSSTGKSAVLPGLKVTGNLKKGNSADNLKTIEPSSDIELLGLSVFKDDKLIGWLSQQESLGFNYITDNVTHSGLVTDCPSGKQKISYEVMRSKTKVKGKIQQGVPRVELFVRTEMNIDEIACHMDLANPATIVALQEDASKYLEQFLTNTIKTVRTKYKTDIFGFGEVLHRADPRAWRALNGNWDKQFADLQVAVKAEVKIRNMGTVIHSMSKVAGKE
ncbi:Ger(x)C family spore germination protein [Bacillus sp. FJAT-28004]|uniref:Ger(x)C family spore germination protein n=1 Tax=Bacillus sp. FJAT-28004 TaxID=1679165 RepID=UPI0006B65BE7|nr:Ger(x)C family spore germination protein [Bacillus sp. FJAT-28004]